MAIDASRILENPERFWSKVRKTDGCWQWTAAIHHSGYGMFGVKKTMVQAHRLAYELCIGEIPEGMFACHTCDNRSCVNPKHIFIGTAKDNTRDMFSKGRAIQLRERHWNAKLTESDVLQIRDMWRSGLYTQSQIAKRFGVDRAHISGLVNNKYWKSKEACA